MKASIQLEVITPAMATEFLNKNAANRKFKFANVKTYAADMKAGKWTPGISMLQFYESGDIADGQNRLKAIELTGIPQSFFIRTGLKREDGLNIDTHAPRTLSDAARIAGSDESVTNTLWSVVRVIETGERVSSKMSNSQKIEIIEKHRDAAEWALSRVKKSSSIKIAMVLGSVGRAFYVESDHAKLAQFCSVVSTGFANGPHETAAISIRNFLIANPKASASAEDFRLSFLKVQNAISYFMRGKPLTVIKSVGSEAYPLK